MPNNEIYLRKGTGTAYDTVYHEAVHAHAHEDDAKNNPFYNAYASYRLELRHKYGDDYLGFGSKITVDEVRQLSALGKQYDSVQNSPDRPQTKWKGITGNDVYDVDLAEKFGEGAVKAREKEWIAGPRLGCVGFYACTSYAEDRAEFASYAASRDSSFFVPLMAPPGNPGYDPQKYDPRYKQKLDLSLQLGDISRETYDRIIDAVEGPKESPKENAIPPPGVKSPS